MRRWISTREAVMLAVVLFLFIVGSASAGLAQPLDPTHVATSSNSGLECHVSPALFHSEPELCNPANGGSASQAEVAHASSVQSPGIGRVWFAISALPLAAIIAAAVRMKRGGTPALSH